MPYVTLQLPNDIPTVLADFIRATIDVSFEELHRTRTRVGLSTRNPLKNPIAGDIVEAPAGWSRRSPVTRRVVGCDEFRRYARGIMGEVNRTGELGYALHTCEAGHCWSGMPFGRVHWIKHSGKGHRFGLLILKSWRSWSRGGKVLELGREP